MGDEKVIACRCEDVTLASIREAVELGHRDLESVKRYTGFGTGWCQGKQCVALAARELVALGCGAPEAPITPRPPFHPVPLAHLAALELDGEGGASGGDGAKGGDGEGGADRGDPGDRAR